MSRPDKRGYFGDYGGKFVPETLMPALSELESAYAEALKDKNFQKEFSRLCREYGRRMRAMKTAIDDRLAGRVEYSPPGGGFFFWLRLLDGGDAAAVLPVAKKNRVAFVPGSVFSAGKRLQDRLRLSFSYHPADVLLQGIQRLEESLTPNRPIV